MGIASRVGEIAAGDPTVAVIETTISLGIFVVGLVRGPKNPGHAVTNSLEDAINFAIRRGAFHEARRLIDEKVPSYDRSEILDQLSKLERRYEERQAWETEIRRRLLNDDVVSAKRYVMNLALTSAEKQEATERIEAQHELLQCSRAVTQALQELDFSEARAIVERLTLRSGFQELKAVVKARIDDYEARVRAINQIESLLEQRSFRKARKEVRRMRISSSQQEDLLREIERHERIAGRPWWSWR